MKKILDVCCSRRAFWFNPSDRRVIYMDKRSEHIVRRDSSNVKGIREFDIAPDILARFENVPFRDGLFSLVVFDPPHLATLGKNSYMAKQYGRLWPEWRESFRRGFAECFRVLRAGGVLIFKWCEYEFPVSEVLALTDEPPLFGHKSGKRSKTHWICFIKEGEKR